MEPSPEQSRKSQPSLDPVSFGGRDWIRDHPKRCPWCKNTFYSYRLTDDYLEPHREDPEPKPGGPERETCGNYLCRVSEEKHRFRRMIQAGLVSCAKTEVELHQEPVAKVQKLKRIDE